MQRRAEDVLRFTGEETEVAEKNPEEERGRLSPDRKKDKKNPEGERGRLSPGREKDDWPITPTSSAARRADNGVSGILNGKSSGCS